MGAERGGGGGGLTVKPTLGSPSVYLQDVDILSRYRSMKLDLKSSRTSADELSSLAET